MTSAASGRFSYHMLGKATGGLGTRLGSGGSRDSGSGSVFLGTL